MNFVDLEIGGEEKKPYPIAAKWVWKERLLESPITCSQKESVVRWNWDDMKILGASCARTNS